MVDLRYGFCKDFRCTSLGSKDAEGVCHSFFSDLRNEFLFLFHKIVEYLELRAGWATIPIFRVDPGSTPGLQGVDLGSIQSRL